MALSRKDLAELRAAREQLEHPGFAITLASMVGTPVEYAMKKLPGPISTRIESATRSALRTAL
jgi:hypothetical protein